MNIIGKKGIFRIEYYPYEEFEATIIDKIIDGKTIENEVQAKSGYGKIKVNQHITINYYLVELENKTIKKVKCDTLLKLL